MAQAQSASWGRRRWLSVGAGLGFVSAVAQVLLLRELLVGFRGNELSLGISLAAWLMWVAIGNVAGGRLARLGRPDGGLTTWASAFALLIFGFLPIAGVWLARDLRSILGIGWGEFIPLSRLALATALLIAPVGFLGGLAFPLICRAAEVRAGVRPRLVYLAESLGFLAGGIATLAAGGIIAPFAAALTTALLAATFALLAAWHNPVGRYTVAVWIAVIAGALFGGVPGRLESSSLARLYPGQKIVGSAYSRYGSWVALGLAEQASFYHNGALAFTAPDLMSAETLAHLSLLEHPRPRRALLIGGGLDGTAAEMLKHPGLHLDYVELDPGVIALARACSQRMGLGVERVMTNPRLHFYQLDGRLFVKRAAAAHARYDFIIVNLPEPSTALLNRFYTVEFFAEARRALSANGVLCISLPGAENFIGVEMQALHGAVYHSLRRVFPAVVVTPTEHAYLFASPRSGYITADADALAARWRSRAVPAQYFGPYYIEAILPADRVEFVRRSCESAPRAINHDFRPVGYFHDVALAGLAEGILPPGAAARVRGLPAPLLALSGLAVFAVPFALSRRGERLRRGAVVGGVAAAGLAGMTLELCLLLALQVLNGHVYSLVGALIALFMAGLAAGAWNEGRALSAGRRPGPRWLAWLVAGAAIAGVTPFILTALKASAALAGWPSTAAIGLLMAGGGAVVGALFPLAVNLLGDSASVAGTVYAADLAGAALGALLGAVMVIPLLGLTGACCAAAIMLAAAALLGALVLRRSRPDRGGLDMPPAGAYK